MSIVRTAKGNVIDMAALALEHENVRAVGNIPMHANGDRIDESGNVIATVQRIAQVQHANDTAPKTVNISDIPAAITDTAADNELPVKPVELMVVSETKKQRTDGTHYIEIEFDDGSMEIKELPKTAKSATRKVNKNDQK